MLQPGRRKLGYSLVISDINNRLSNSFNIGVISYEWKLTWLCKIYGYLCGVQGCFAAMFNKNTLLWNDVTIFSILSVVQALNLVAGFLQVSGDFRSSSSKFSALVPVVILCVLYMPSWWTWHMTFSLYNILEFCVSFMSCMWSGIEIWHSLCQCCYLPW